MRPLGPAYNDLFFFARAAARAYDERIASSGFANEDWVRGQCHDPLLDAMYEPALHLLPRLTAPSLLLHGRRDLVTPPAAIDAYRRWASSGTVHTFEHSGHFAYHEEPGPYADTVIGFVSSMPSARPAPR